MTVAEYQITDPQHIYPIRHVDTRADGPAHAVLIALEAMMRAPIDSVDEQVVRNIIAELIVDLCQPGGLMEDDGYEMLETPNADEVLALAQES